MSSSNININFRPIPARQTFFTQQQNCFASDYIQRKKAKMASCFGKNSYDKRFETQSYDFRNSFFRGETLGGSQSGCNLFPYGKNNLIVGMYNTQNLTDVVTICDISNNIDCISSPTCTNVPSTTIDPERAPFYENYLIDPNGTLYGNTTCNLNNFMVYSTNNP